MSVHYLDAALQNDRGKIMNSNKPGSLLKNVTSVGSQLSHQPISCFKIKVEIKCVILNYIICLYIGINVFSEAQHFRAYENDRAPRDGAILCDYPHLLNIKFVGCFVQNPLLNRFPQTASIC